VVVSSRSRLIFPTSFVRPVLTETIWLTVICLLDLVSTLILVSEGHAEESNPILEPLLTNNPPMFVVVKLMSFLLPLAIIESVRDRAPGFITVALRAGIAGYLFIYVFGSLSHLFQR
jgi:hypothetical protein